MRSGKTAAQTEALVAWLESVTPTAPFTIADAKALYDMIKNAAGVDSKVEVHGTDHRGARIHVLIQKPDGSVVDRIIDVV